MSKLAIFLAGGVAYAGVHLAGRAVLESMRVADSWAVSQAFCKGVAETFPLMNCDIPPQSNRR